MIQKSVVAIKFTSFTAYKTASVDTRYYVLYILLPLLYTASWKIENSACKLREADLRRTPGKPQVSHLVLGSFCTTLDRNYAQVRGKEVVMMVWCVLGRVYARG